ncbi:probable protein phosphatase 2C 55 isoform X2 [Olea europaea var. sylvestris]|uniref:probable protein phosphatase 2C 55 isoform X2 n=1 Tax=Olea europaea var. sylvestris TaxID=158386 RepID=UPI000C1CE648|nr:probable protein phosphatase 2C 55 isoform X2 [Olea europaea var. sylvestris]
MEDFLSQNFLFAPRILGEWVLKLLFGACYMPHSAKEETGGEDAHFIYVDEQAIGVAEGVDGWAHVGINAGEYARELMTNSVPAIRDEPNGDIDPLQVLEKVQAKTKAMGSSTACIIALKNQVDEFCTLALHVSILTSYFLIFYLIRLSSEINEKIIGQISRSLRSQKQEEKLV